MVRLLLLLFLIFSNIPSYSQNILIGPDFSISSQRINGIDVNKIKMDNTGSKSIMAGLTLQTTIPNISDKLYFGINIQRQYFLIRYFLIQPISDAVVYRNHFRENSSFSLIGFSGEYNIFLPKNNIISASAGFDYFVSSNISTHSSTNSLSTLNLSDSFRVKNNEFVSIGSYKFSFGLTLGFGKHLNNKEHFTFNIIYRYMPVYSYFGEAKMESKFNNEYFYGDIKYKSNPHSFGIKFSYRFSILNN